MPKAIKNDQEIIKKERSRIADRLERVAYKWANRCAVGKKFDVIEDMDKIISKLRK